MKLPSREQVREKLIAGSIPVTETGCWLWLGGESGDGYGHTRWGSHYKAHRLSYIIFRGPIAEGRQVDHLCKVRCCINPDHLEVVTPRVNTLRSSAFTADQARQTHCHKGHEFTEANTCKQGNHRVCRACKRAEWHRRQARIKARQALDGKEAT